MKYFFFAFLLAVSACAKAKNIRKEIVGASASVRTCSSEVLFDIETMTAIPAEFSRGEYVTTQVTGKSQKAYWIQDMQISIKHNGNEVDHAEQFIGEDLDEFMPYNYEYTYNLPSDMEPGKWEIEMLLRDGFVNPIICTCTYFDLE